MLEIKARIAWRRLDRPGDDACSLVRGADGWTLEGVARWRDGRTDCRLAYRVDTDGAWVTRRGRVR